jgi:hypothetical protein
MASEAMAVARQSRRNSHTTTTARPAPIISASTAPRKPASTKSTVAATRRISTPGCAASSAARRAAAPSATRTSEEPRVRMISKPTTGRPSSRAAVRTSAFASDTSAISPSRAVRPPGRIMGRSRSASTERAEPRVRMVCSPSPSVPRPPGRFTFSARSWSLTWLAVTPRASSRSGRSATRISRSTPPTRFTCETPDTESSALATVSSTNQESCSSEKRGAATV